MTTLNPDEERLRDFLAARAADADPSSPEASTIRLKDIAAQIDPDGDLGWNRPPRFPPLWSALRHVNMHEAEQGRPMVGALAVNGKSAGSVAGFIGVARELGRPTGTGEDAEREFWLRELASAIRYWSRRSGTGLAGGAALTESQFDTIMAELGAIKRMLHEVLGDRASRGAQADRPGAGRS